MAELRFLEVLISNIKCAFCAYKNCPSRYYPNRKRYHYYEGVRYVESCQKDREKKWNDMNFRT